MRRKQNYTRSKLRAMFSKKRPTYLDSGQWKEYKYARKRGQKY